jgi:PEP-CTERM motif
VVLGDDGLVKEFSYIDFVKGSPSSITGLSNPDSFGTIPDGITVLIGDDGHFSAGDGFFVFTCEMCFGFVHEAEGAGVWTRVPEPATLALLVLGFVAATRRRRLHRFAARKRAIYVVDRQGLNDDPPSLRRLFERVRNVSISS